MSNNTFCPLYADILEKQPWKKKQNAHMGLVVDKFADGWYWSDGILEFAKSQPVKSTSPKSWLDMFPVECGSKAHLNDACQQQRKLIRALDGKIIPLCNTSRFVTGTGRNHPLENGMTWHHTLGTPYLPGSSLKGLLRAWCREEETQEAKTKIDNWFGATTQVGKFILLDMIPKTPLQVEVDIMTPHYGPYYQDKDKNIPPAEWHDPNPIPFLVVQANATWQLGIIPGPQHRGISDDDLQLLNDYLENALQILGAGAKTASGYGHFKPQATSNQPSQHSKHQKITITCKGGKKRRFVSDDGRGCTFINKEEIPSIKSGETVEVWIVKVNGNQYEVSTSEPR